MIDHMQSEKSVFIKLLEYGEAVGTNGTRVDKMIDWALKNGIIPLAEDKNHFENMVLLEELFYECFIKNDKLEKDIWVLKGEYFTRLLEYRELNEARESSRKANRNALFAIALSIVTLLLTLTISYLQLHKPTTISEKQLNKLTNHLDKIEKNRYNQTEHIINIIQTSKIPTIKLDNSQYQKIIDTFNNHQHFCYEKKNK